MTLEKIQTNLKNYYRDLCIRENAFNHLTNEYNQNYEQRRIVVMDMFFMAGMGLPEMDEIEHDVNQHIWVNELNHKGQYVYKILEEDSNELTKAI